MNYRPGRVTVTTTYPEFRRTAFRDGRCPSCEVKVKRQRTFAKTVSPYNLVADRSRPKTPEEVRESVNAEAAAWDPDPEIFRHDACRDE